MEVGLEDYEAKGQEIKMNWGLFSSQKQWDKETDLRARTSQKVESKVGTMERERRN